MTSLGAFGIAGACFACATESREPAFWAQHVVAALLLSTNNLMSLQGCFSPIIARSALIILGLHS